MSRDVVALALAFAGGAELDAVCAHPPPPLDGETGRRFALTLRARDVLVDEGGDDPPALGARRPYVPERAVWQCEGDDAVVWGRAGSLRLAGGAALLDRADGTRALSELAP